MAEDSGDFLNVMGDEDDGGDYLSQHGLFEEFEKVLPGDGIKAGARLIEDEEPRLRHQRPSDTDTLPFALGQTAPPLLGEMFTAEPGQDLDGIAVVSPNHSGRTTDGGILAADHGFRHCFPAVDLLKDAVAYQPI